MIYKYTKCESVIAKIMSDLDSSEARNRISDIREWIFEAIEKIGAPMQYLHKESGSDGIPILKIQDNQVPLPDDLVYLDVVAYSRNENGPWQAMSTKTGVFKEPIRNHGNKYPATYKYPTTQAQFLNTNTNRMMNKSFQDNNMRKPEYFIKPGWIVTNINEGYIKLSYKAIATDERGYPLIPDLPSYQEAIYWYVVMKLSFSKFLKGHLGGKGVNNNGNVYNYIRQQWNFYCAQAYAEAMMPTADDMQNIKRDWNKLIPDFDGDETFFDNIGIQQSVYNDYYYGY